MVIMKKMIMMMIIIMMMMVTMMTKIMMMMMTKFPLLTCSNIVSSILTTGKSPSGVTSSVRRLANSLQKAYVTCRTVSDSFVTTVWALIGSYSMVNSRKILCLPRCNYNRKWGLEGRGA